MQHELLLALSGYPGNVFSTSTETGAIEVAPDVPFIHPSEVSILNRICSLGTHYKHLKEFVWEQYSSPLTRPATSTTTESGLYLRALAHGLECTLDAYREALVRTEHECISDPHLPLTHLQHIFEEFQILLPSLDNCLRHVQKQKLHGCQILSYLHEQCSSGFPILQNAYKKILWTCHGVLYKQLSAFMVHGVLLDEWNEFFIERGQRSQESSGVQDGTHQFRIAPALLPSYIPARVADKVLFTGEAIQIFHKRSQELHHTSPLTPLSQATADLKADQYKFGTYFLQLQQKPSFQLRELETVVEDIRESAGQHLWRLVVEECHLVDHLQTIKSFFLLGRGELYQAFVDLSSPFMKVSQQQVTEHDVNACFKQALVKVGIESDNLSKQFVLTMAPATAPVHVGPPAASGDADSPWERLGLCYTVSWPHHLLFTPPVLEKYNSLFKFLLSIRRTQMALHHCWALLMQHKKHSRELAQVWQLRRHMGFLVDNVQYYVQVDVLEAQFSVLLSKISSTHDFEHIRLAHDQFIASLQTQLLLANNAVSKVLKQILEECNALSRLLQQYLPDLTSPDCRAQIEKINKSFKLQSSLLFKILSAGGSYGSAPHLAQLLLRVDYNKYFSTQYPLHSAAKNVAPSRPA